ncbi:MAG: hypothetical protein ACRDRK_09160 [Pseudonocardia sp.]
MDRTGVEVERWKMWPCGNAAIPAETYRLAANDPDRVVALDCALLDSLDGWFHREATSTGVFSCEYVLSTARRSA